MPVDGAQPRLGALLRDRIVRQSQVLVADLRAGDDVERHGRGRLLVVAVETTGALGRIEDHGRLGFLALWMGNTITFSGSAGAAFFVFRGGFGAAA